MKGARFYADYGDEKTKRAGGQAPNALVLFPETRDRDGFDCIAAAHYTPNSGVCGTHVSRDYLRSACKRISETEAYRIHPTLARVMRAGKVAR